MADEAGAGGTDPESSPGSGPAGDPASIERTERQREYWRRNLRYVGILLAVWFVVSYGAGILFAEPLNQYRIPGTGFPAGFWFAQQGSIYVFVILIFVYVYLMNRLDREFDVDEGELE
ncbi:MAG: DUF4212 domain-containing protein [Longimicrobiales bacterium]|nr:DUF4212 domain-containing protein [Longimicrobiales bacterium]